VSPSANAGTLIEFKYVQALKKIHPTSPNQKMEYAVVRASMASAQLIRTTRQKWGVEAEF